MSNLGQCIYVNWYKLAVNIHTPAQLNGEIRGQYW